MGCNTVARTSGRGKTVKSPDGAKGLKPWNSDCTADESALATGQQCMIEISYH